MYRSVVVYREQEFRVRTSIPRTGAAFGIGWKGDTSPRLGCCKVAEGSCGGNLLKVRRLIAKWVVRGYCGSNLLLPLGEPVESTKREAGTGIPARSRACSLRSAVRKGSPLRSDRCAARLRAALTDGSAAAGWQL